MPVSHGACNFSLKHHSCGKRIIINCERHCAVFTGFLPHESKIYMQNCRMWNGLNSETLQKIPQLVKINPQLSAGEYQMPLVKCVSLSGRIQLLNEPEIQPATNAPMSFDKWRLEFTKSLQTLFFRRARHVQAVSARTKRLCLDRSVILVQFQCCTAICFQEPHEACTLFIGTFFLKYKTYEAHRSLKWLNVACVLRQYSIIQALYQGALSNALTSRVEIKRQDNLIPYFLLPIFVWNPLAK